jgi:NAD(P)-dependent dehydrogenase (short-subunit alcohol dehydrogenase family)
VTGLDHPFDLTGRVAVVTGAGSGIGRASAQRLAQAGATVVCADRNTDGATATVQSVVEAGGTAEVATVDVSRGDEVRDLVETTVRRLGRLDVMANIAGVMHRSLVLDTDEADLDRVLDINLKGVFFGAQAAARVMVEAGGGSIVNMASAAVDQPAPELAAYGMAKAGLVQLTKVLAQEVGQHGVRVNAVAPGYVRTPMTDRTKDDGMAMFTPLRTVGEPDDIAYAVLYLASDASRFMTGQILRPNGGVAMPW